MQLSKDTNSNILLTALIMITSCIAMYFISFSNTIISGTDKADETLPRYKEHSLSSGFWNKSTWVSLSWENKQFRDSDSVGQCIRNKHVYIMGDSTMHLLFMALCKQLNVSSMIENFGDKYAVPSSVPTSIYVEDYNATLFFVFHQMRNGAPRYFNISIFEAVVLDRLHSTECNYIVGLGFGIHFLQWSKYAFEDRLSHIVAAVNRLRSRCPDVPVFVKGPHMSGANQFELNKAISRSDYIAKEIVDLMKKEFSRINVIFVDTWDLNLSFPSAPMIHMPEAAYRQELFLSLSQVC